MTKKDLNNWIMYHEIHHLARLGFSISRISRYLVSNRRTISKYLDMAQNEYEQYLARLQHRDKILSGYEEFVSNRLTEFPDTSAAQIHDWLKEVYSDIPEVSPRTVYNFVMYVRQTYNIPYSPSYREYFPIEELPYGEQAQVDFGEYNMRTSSGKRKKIRFFAMVMSRSRMKYVCFIDKPFTAELVVQAHENAFKFFGGIPETIVYDQDRTMIVDENLGKIILTSTFSQYTRSRSFHLHFCRKADPESKGKVENVIQYVKKNFLYNRLYEEIEMLNKQAIAWLSRTANYLPHNLTKKTPESEFIIEREHLKTYIPMAIENKETKTYLVRKDNTINYKSNFYTLPEGTYKGSNIVSNVIVKKNEDAINIYSLENEFICSHEICLLVGKTIRNTDHKRDKSKSIDEMIRQAVDCFSNPKPAIEYFERIRKTYPRYTRDHMQVIIKELSEVSIDIADKTLDFCLNNDVLHGKEWEQVSDVFVHESLSEKMATSQKIELLNKRNLDKAEQAPQISDIEDYEIIINPSVDKTDNKK
jgi:transposase